MQSEAGVEKMVLRLWFFTCVSYAEARNRYRLYVCPSARPSVRLSVRHTLVLYQNG